MKKLSLFILLLTALSSFAEQSAPIIRFMKIDKEVFRGARPGQIGIQYLARMGVKTIINLEDNAQEAAQELAYAKTYGIKTLSFPMDTFAYPEDHYINRVMAEVNRTNNWPIYIHCQFGKDRTGLISGLYRVFNQHWTPDEAYQEMLHMGFSPFLVKMKNYFYKKTDRRY